MPNIQDDDLRIDVDDVGKSSELSVFCLWCFHCKSLLDVSVVCSVLSLKCPLLEWSVGYSHMWLGLTQQVHLVELWVFTYCKHGNQSGLQGFMLVGVNRGEQSFTPMSGLHQ